MVTFLDGLAEGVTLMLRRAPKFLRVVRSRRGEWDALDQLDDEPKPQESVHVYLRTKLESPIHIKMSSRSGSGYYARASYEAYPVQPGSGVTHDRKKWRAWTVAEAAKKNPGQSAGAVESSEALPTASGSASGGPG